jgi:glutathione S-transferase
MLQVDPNTGVAMYESDAIIKYLADKYGDGTVPIMLSLGILTVSYDLVLSFYLC